MSDARPVLVSVSGERGKTGDRGERGERGRGPTLWQTLAIFLVVVAVSVGLSIRTELQQDQIRAQQKVIQANTADIVRTRIESCYAGVAYIQRLNEQYDALIAIERSLANDPSSTKVGIRIAKARIRAYTRFKTPIPPNVCPPR